MSISILKRTRVSTDAAWSVWANTTDVPPYTETTLVQYMVVDSEVIDINDVTNGNIATDAEGKSYWTGTGYFDVIMAAMNGNVKAEYESGRIVGIQYAEVYLGALQGALTAAVALATQKPAMAKAQAEAVKTQAETAKTQAETVKTQAETVEVAPNAHKQREVLQAQKELYKRQKAGFDDNKHQKILDAQLNAWGITFQDTDTTFIPTQLQQAGFTTSFDAVRANYYDVCDDVCAQ